MTQIQASANLQIRSPGTATASGAGWVPLQAVPRPINRSRHGTLVSSLPSLLGPYPPQSEVHQEPLKLPLLGEYNFCYNCASQGFVSSTTNPIRSFWAFYCFAITISWEEREKNVRFKYVGSRGGGRGLNNPIHSSHKYLLGALQSRGAGLHNRACFPDSMKLRLGDRHVNGSHHWERVLFPCNRGGQTAF